MLKLTLSLLLISVIYCPSSHALFWETNQSKCLELDWAQNNARSQAGGFIWYPGKGVGSSKAEAIVRAKGLALESIVEECVFAHKEIKIHEQCHDKIGDFFHVYLRITLQDKYCKESRYAKPKLKKIIKNVEMEEVLFKYRKLIAKTTVLKNTDCNEGAILKCFDLGKFYFEQGNKEEALSLFEQGCKYKHRDSCFNTGLLIMMAKDDRKAWPYFSNACEAGDAESCLFAGRLKSGKVKQKFLRKSCEMKNPEGCIELGDLFEKKNDLVQAKNYYEISCNLKHPAGCHFYSFYFNEIGDIKNALKFSKKSCKMNYYKACYNYANLIKSKNLKIKYFTTACYGGYKTGCFQVGKLKSNSKDDSSMRMFLKGCDLGHKLSCQEASTLYYDKKDFVNSIKYANHGCEMGSLKSCHNAGYLAFKNGNKEDAIQSLSYACKKGYEVSCKYKQKLSK